MFAALLVSVCLLVTNPEPVVVQVWFGENCPACEHFKPVIFQLQSEGWKINCSSYEQYKEIARKQGVTGVPATVIFKGPKILGRWAGNASADWVRAVLTTFGVSRNPPIRKQ